MFIFLGYRPGTTIVLGPANGSGTEDIKYSYSQTDKPATQV